MALTYWVDFFDDLQHVRGRSLNTVQAYRRDLELFDEFLQISSNDLSQIYHFLNQKKLSTRTQARVISSIRTYYRFCADRGDKIPDLTQLRPPRVSVRLPQALHLDDFHKLYEASAVEDVHKTARNHITLLLLFGLGCRVSELIDVNLQDFNETEGWLKVTGKGDKERLVPLTTPLLAELKVYIREVRTHLVKDTNLSILINDRGHRPSRVDIWRWLDAWSHKAGFEHTVNPHKFRHGCATALLDAGADLRSIQKLLGHSSIQTTQIYTSVSTNKMRETIDTHHPLSGFDKATDIDGEI